MNNSEILIITSYPPRKCGIATYSQDLIQSIEDKYTEDFSIRGMCFAKQRRSNGISPSGQVLPENMGKGKIIPAWPRPSILIRTLRPSTCSMNLDSMVVNWGTT
jgi:hypothetical protein